MTSRSTQSSLDMGRIQDVNVRRVERLLSPDALQERLPLTKGSYKIVVESRERIKAILRQDDPRLMVIVGPCSIHHVSAALEYASKLKELRDKYEDQLEIIMRVYFEKPRTTVGWKGLINDPNMDSSLDIEAGLDKARKLLLDITGVVGMPAATEFLDPRVPQYTGDLVSWAAIGARTTESQTHREMASGLSMPVGLKNGTDGSVETAIAALKATQGEHSFMGIDREGRGSIITTMGNPDAHIILRGGRETTNYDPKSIGTTLEKLAGAGQRKVIMVDCSHANSGKKHSKQEEVWRSVIGQRVAGNLSIIGLMLESNLFEGNQPIPKDLNDLRYGVSVTDECMGWEDTARLLEWTYETLVHASKKA